MSQALIPGKRVAGKPPRPPSFRVSAPDVVRAVESLYADHVRPCGRILLKRLGEHVQQGTVALDPAALMALPSGEVPRIDTVRLRRVCEQAPQLRVVAEGSEYCALLPDREANFVDAASNEDPYPDSLWDALAAHFDGPGLNSAYPGGRYACARTLQQASLPFLDGLNLGQICLIVQLAISKRQILGYFEGQIVAYARSEAVLKQHCAILQQPAWALKKDAMSVATLAEARRCLATILSQPQSDGSWAVPLPNIKRLFRSRFGLELSETALGHSRLCELLQDQRFSDVCSVQLQGNTYAVLPAELSQAMSPVVSSGCVPDSASESGHSSTDVPSNSAASDGSLEDSLAHTLAQIQLAWTPPPGARQHTSSTHQSYFGMCVSSFDRNLVQAGDDQASPERMPFCAGEPLCFDGLGLEPAYAPLTPCPYDEAAADLCGTLHAGIPAVVEITESFAETPSPTSTGEPFFITVVDGRCSDGTREAPPLPTTMGVGSSKKRVRFCEDDPLDWSALQPEVVASPPSCLLSTPSPQLASQSAWAQKSWITLSQDYVCSTPSPLCFHPGAAFEVVPRRAPGGVAASSPWTWLPGAAYARLCP